MMIRTTLLVLGTAGLMACEPPEGPNTTKSAPPAAAKPATPAPAAQAGPRTVSAEAHAAMKDKLVAEGAKKAWILSQPGNPEVATLVARSRASSRTPAGKCRPTP
jgi:hypothetical protein